MNNNYCILWSPRPQYKLYVEVCLLTWFFGRRSITCIQILTFCSAPWLARFLSLIPRGGSSYVLHSAISKQDKRMVVPMYVWLCLCIVVIPHALPFSCVDIVVVVVVHRFPGSGVPCFDMCTWSVIMFLFAPLVDRSVRLSVPVPTLAPAARCVDSTCYCLCRTYTFPCYYYRRYTGSIHTSLTHSLAARWLTYGCCGCSQANPW